MIQEDKALLLKDLCARIPYGVKMLHDYDKKFEEGLICSPSGLTKYEDRTCITAFGVMTPIELDEIKMYLRPMSSMTNEERKEFEELWNEGFGKALDAQISNGIKVLNNAEDLNFNECLVSDLEIIASSNAIDWFNEHHFDFRNLIKKGLSLEAPEGMYD